ncbi:MAG: COX15/CtaA family protein [Xanthomonadaceae bacterium]|nr:COX15/CtaA family protein [Xanthomonadaceae bacterium]
MFSKLVLIAFVVTFVVVVLGAWVRLSLPLAIAALVVFQALLGMWTVTLLLKPAIVMAHLLGGMTILALLWLLLLRSAGMLRAPPIAGLLRAPPIAGLRGLAYAAVAVVALQIALGGWTSANYAALACPDFPTCQAEWWPDMDFKEGFVLWREVGVDYEGGLLDLPARAAIHKAHRLGALFTLLFVGALALTLWLRGRQRVWRGLGVAIGGMLLLQVLVGVLTVVRGHPLALAAAHNAGAALLLLSVVALAYAAARNR